jgi:hypothetical protein
MKRMPRKSVRVVALGIIIGVFAWGLGLALTPAAGSGQVKTVVASTVGTCSLEATGAAGEGGLGDDYARPFKGWQDCNRCHDTGVKGTVKIGGVEVELDKERWVLYREFPIWAEKDKHVQAYAILLNERSQKMGKILKTEVHRDKRCLACHTGFPVGHMPDDKDDAAGLLVAPEVQKNLDVKFGVSCEGCHGPAGDKDKALPGWHGPHQQSDPWRFLAPDTKRKDFGFWDVRSPASRTKICASCHIGSMEHGRVVTHDMYAAGHPPLPGFEVETFGRQMPAHWAKFNEKSEPVIEQFVKNTKDPIYREGSYKKENLRESRALLVGALAASSEYYNLIADLADEKAKGPVARPDWPELAMFDCYACHHELKGPAWRQVRKPPAGVPGRPFVQEWNTGLLKLALKRLGDAPKEYEAKFEAVRQGLNKQPFGNREELKTSARALGAWLWSRAEELQKRPVTPAEGTALLKEIAAQASSDIWDYESARHFVWAYKVVDEELKRPASAKIEAILDPLAKDMFLLDLRAGRKATAVIPGETGKRTLVEVDLAIVLPFVANYDPTQFRDRFLEIKGLLK